MTTDPKTLADQLEQAVGILSPAQFRHLIVHDLSLILAALCAASSAEAMRKALKPFADVAERFEDWGEPGYANMGLTLKIVTRDDEEENLRVGDLWRARAALSPDPGPAPVEGWRPIETVPEGVEVVVWGGCSMFGTPYEGSRIMVVDNRADLYREDDGTLRRTSPTMWHPAPPPPAEPSRDAQEEPAPWPAGCIKPGSCGRNEQCMYAMSVEKCRHYGRNLAEDVHAHRKPALAAARQEGEKPLADLHDGDRA